ncbi:MAG: hypothetical protein RLY70_731 [Planctomycetota bacterium]
MLPEIDRTAIPATHLGNVLRDTTCALCRRPAWRTSHTARALRLREKVSGLFSGELSSEKIPRREDPNVQTKRAGFITP